MLCRSSGVALLWWPRRSFGGVCLWLSSARAAQRAALTGKRPRTAVLWLVMHCRVTATFLPQFGKASQQVWWMAARPTLWHCNAAPRARHKQLRGVLTLFAAIYTFPNIARKKKKKKTNFTPLEGPWQASSLSSLAVHLKPAEFAGLIGQSY